MVREVYSRVVLVSLIMAVNQSSRKASTSSPLGYASARSLSFPSVCFKKKINLDRDLPNNAHGRSHQRLSTVAVVGNDVKKSKDGRDIWLQGLRWE